MIKKILRGVIFIGFSVQAALGLAWMCANLFRLQDFPEVSGGAYAVVARLLGKAYPLVFVLQIAAAFYAGKRLAGRLCGCAGRRGPAASWRVWLKGCLRELPALWGGLVFLTFPMAMQCHLALLPCSLVCSAGLLELSFFCEIFQMNEVLKPGMVSKNAEFYENSELVGRGEAFRIRVLAGICGCYLAQAALAPEYLFLGAVSPALAVFMARKGIAREKKRLQTVLVLALTAALALGIYALGNGGREEGSGNDISGPEWTLTKRVCWPTLWNDTDVMPDELWEVVKGDILWQSSYYPENMDSVFQPAVEAAMDAETAKKLLVRFSAGVWKNRYPMIIRQIGWDVLGYSVTPLILQLQLEGRAYESCSGGNYARMRSGTPALTERYLDYGSWWFAWMIILTAMLLLVRALTGEKPLGQREKCLFWTVLPGAALCVLWYTLQGAGIMDYKYTVLVNELWLLWGVKESAVCIEPGKAGGKEA